MKKLIVGAVAAIAASTAFCVESANVVGYAQTPTMNTGAKVLGGMFIPVAGESVNLQDIKVVGYEGENADTVNIQTLDSIGRTVNQYFWADLPDDGICGWLNGDEELPDDVEFAPGSGLWVVSSDPTLSLQFAGQVPTSGIAVALRVGATTVANATPVSVNLQDIVVSGYEGENADTVNIQILDSVGRTTAQYFWADLPDDGIYGWLDGDEEIPENVEFSAGEGLWVVSTDATLSVVIPGVNL